MRTFEGITLFKSCTLEGGGIDWMGLPQNVSNFIPYMERLQVILCVCVCFSFWVFFWVFCDGFSFVARKKFTLKTIHQL